MDKNYIKIYYIKELYPQSKYINNEEEIVRIVDENIKETLVIYLYKRGNIHELKTMNTSTGEENVIECLKSSHDIGIAFNYYVKNNEGYIKNLKNLDEVEKHILNIKI